MTLHHIAAGDRNGAQVEFLEIRGFLTTDLNFHTMVSHSVFSLQPSPRRPDGEYFAELRDEKGNPLNRQAIDVFEPVVCFNHHSSIQLVYGRIAFRKEASRLLIYKNEILIDERPIFEPPFLELTWNVKRTDRKKKYPIAIRYSKPSPGAYLQLFYQWDEKKYHSLGLLAPKKKININFAKRPGGKACRLIVAYTNNMRTTVAKTHSFTVPRREPLARIVSPAESATFALWHPVTLTGQISRLDGGKVEKDDLVWYLNNKIIGKGRVITTKDLPSGKHKFVLRLQDNHKVLARKTINVVKSKVK